jgi:hypothetical protein
MKAHQDGFPRFRCVSTVSAEIARAAKQKAPHWVKAWAYVHDRRWSPRPQDGEHDTGDIKPPSSAS